VHILKELGLEAGGLRVGAGRKRLDARGGEPMADSLQTETKEGLTQNERRGNGKRESFRGPEREFGEGSKVPYASFMTRVRESKKRKVLRGCL
jgi:hypothetical protein